MTDVMPFTCYQRKQTEDDDVKQSPAVSPSIESAVAVYREALKRQEAALLRMHATRKEHEEARESYDVAKYESFEAEKTLLTACAGRWRQDEEKTA